MCPSASILCGSFFKLSPHPFNISTGNQPSEERLVAWSSAAGFNFASFDFSSWLGDAVANHRSTAPE